METDKKRACALVRVSTEEQARGGYGLEFQEGDIRKFCDRNGLELLRVFRDEGYSGTTPHRPGFQEMMAWAREKRFDILVVWKLDRLFRDTKLTLQAVDDLTQYGVEFRSVQESFTHDSNGRFLLTIFAAGAEKERKDINLRMSSGRIAAAKRGVFINGISTPAYGYRYDAESRKLVIVKEEAAVVRQIFYWLVSEKISLYRIQQRLNDSRTPTKYDQLGRKKGTSTTGWWHKRTIGRILENESYTGSLMLQKYKSAIHSKKEGNLRPKEDWIAVKTPQIISRSTFEMAQDQLVRNTANSPRNTKKLYLLSKLLICGNDHKKMMAVTMPSGKNGADVPYYFCNGMNKTNAAIPCRSRYVREDRMVPPVWDKLRELLLNPSVVLKELAEYQKHRSMVSDAETKKRRLEAIKNTGEQQLRRLAEVYVGGAIEKAFYDNEYRRLRDQKDEVNRQLKKLEAFTFSAEQMGSAAGAIQGLYERFQTKLENASDETKREVFQTFIKSIVVGDQELEVEVNLPDCTEIEGQSPYQLFRNRMPPLFLRTRLIPGPDQRN
jgi:site-specific DNA recombinase